MAQKISWSSLFFSIYMPIIIVILCKSTSAQNYDCGSNTTIFVNNSQYEANLNTLFRYLLSNATDPNGYHQAVSSNGNPNSEAIYGHFLCRGDLNASACQTCVDNVTATDLPMNCPNRKEAIVWRDECMIRYSNQSFFGKMDTSPMRMLLNTLNVTGNSTRFEELRDNMMNNVIANRAPTGGSLKKFATDFVNVTMSQTIYGLGQCTPDLAPSDCNTCLLNGIQQFKMTQGAHNFQPSCVVQYEIYSFFDLSSVAPPPQPLPLPPRQSPTGGFSGLSSGNGSYTGKIAILVTVSTILLIVLAIGFYLLFRRRKSWIKFGAASVFHRRDDSDESTSLVSLQFDFRTIKVATNNFSDDNKLGRGGFGTVYKGRLANGQEVAVKRLAKDSGQGDEEFKTEVLLVAKLQHKNLVRLLGFCIERKERLLIYELLPNTSLDHFLFDVRKRSYLDWRSRYNIIVSIARGILYLHEESRLRIIHRDLKASNILLDAEMNPKIADFGTARLFEVDQTQGDTIRIVGTYAYMPPEYALHGLFSVKSDVYSFGVLVLEIITGRKNRGSPNEQYAEDLINFVWRNWREGTPLKVVDPTLSIRSKTDIIRCIHMGLLCVQENAEDRPTMSFIVLMLSSHSLTLPAPSCPAFVTSIAIRVDTKSHHHTKERTIGRSSVNKDSITDPYPR
ncbi:cysteine-rich receptor-like protein kinase 10 isoform X1 [Chenopodium quinoa]|uniref:cysteine-rich receptor-like protein kinase 10 isoform X1 n=1 Tax=Chenopodium quinoa TaxID=63459 RepID=UPI000B79A833|nr:cysteine-rich receptor-like protein kinase 10 isoform X1 [Chenopodium quinoa]